MSDSVPVPNLPPAPQIPSAFSASIRSWWNAGEKSSAISEQRLLSLLPFHTPQMLSTNSSDSPVLAESSKVQLSNPKHYINTISMKATQPSPNAPPPAVMLHGYGAGLGFYFRNLHPMAKWAGHRGSSVYAIDWLGMGRSARVPFSVSAKRSDIPGRVSEAEAFFIDSLEDWRKRVGLDKFTLIGHSIGGYLSVAYALKYPHRVNRLVLLSPAGVPRGPDYTAPDREFDDLEITGNDHAPGSEASLAEIERLRAEQQKNAEKENDKRKESKTRRLLTYLWEEGYSPFSVARASTFWAPMIIGKYSARRFSGLSEQDTRNMHDYILNITLAKGSGEYCISHLLAPGAHARMPLCDRIPALKIPVTFVYGEHDWMDPEGGEVTIENMNKAGNSHGKLYLIPNAGHHVYLDNARAVNELLVRELDRDIHSRRLR